MRILMIEDNNIKFVHIARIINQFYECTIERAKSRNSGLCKIRDSNLNKDYYKLLICDNYLPVREHELDIKPRAAEIINYVKHRGYNLLICLCSSEKVDDIQADYYLHYDVAVDLDNRVREVFDDVLQEEAPNNKNGGRTHV